MGEVFFVPALFFVSRVEETSPRLFSIHKRESPLCRRDRGRMRRREGQTGEEGKQANGLPHTKAQAHFTQKRRLYISEEDFYSFFQVLSEKFVKL